MYTVRHAIPIVEKGEFGWPAVIRLAENGLIHWCETLAQIIDFIRPADDLCAIAGELQHVNSDHLIKSLLDLKNELLPLVKKYGLFPFIKIAGCRHSYMLFSKSWGGNLVAITPLINKYGIEPFVRIAEAEQENASTTFYFLLKMEKLVDRLGIQPFVVLAENKGTNWEGLERVSEFIHNEEELLACAKLLGHTPDFETALNEQRQTLLPLIERDGLLPFVALAQTCGRFSGSAFKAVPAAKAHGFSYEQMTALFERMIGCFAQDARYLFSLLPAILNKLDRPADVVMTFLMDILKLFGAHSSARAFGMLPVACEAMAGHKLSDLHVLKELLSVVYMDDYYDLQYSRTYTAESFSSYFTDLQLLEIRYLLEKGDFEALKALGVSTRKIVEAFVLNGQNNIISQYSDLILDLQGKGEILNDLLPLSERVKTPRYRKEDLLEVLNKLDISLEEEELRSLLFDEGFRFYPHDGNTLIIPAVFDVLLSAYRGSAEYDNVEANYLTHAVTTAIIHYAREGGEVKGDKFGPRGAKAFHEFDLGFMRMEGRNNRKVDPGVTLAFHYEGVPLPEYARKRTVCLKSDTVAIHISQLSKWQAKERKLKSNLLQIFGFISSGNYEPTGLDLAVEVIKHHLAALENECGLNAEYYRAGYGYMDENFFALLKRHYKPGGSNRAMLNDLLKKAEKAHPVAATQAREGSPSNLASHPWAIVDNTLLDYLEYERSVRAGTFEDLML